MQCSFRYSRALSGGALYFEVLRGSQITGSTLQDNAADAFYARELDPRFRPSGGAVYAARSGPGSGLQIVRCKLLGNVASMVKGAGELYRFRLTSMLD